MAERSSGPYPLQRRYPPELRERAVRLNKRLRAAFVAGAEEDSQRRLGRGQTADEQERVLWHYPGDIGARSPFREVQE
jgi:hypothetical protein